jgi:hypothetical protein
MAERLIETTNAQPCVTRRRASISRSIVTSCLVATEAARRWFFGPSGPMTAWLTAIRWPQA